MKRENFIKKLTALIISLILCFSVCQTQLVFANTDETENTFDVISFLNNIGVSAVGNDKLYITRGDFTALALQAAGIECMETESYFDDLNENNARFVNTAAEMGIVSADAGKHFRSDDVILMEEAAVICLRILGYENIITDRTYPSGYLSYAVKTGIIKGLSGNSKMSGWDASRMIFNMLDSKYVIVNYTSNIEKITYSLSENSYMEDVLGIYKHRGVIGSICGISLNDSRCVNNEEILINNKIYNNPHFSEINYYKYLGADVEFYTINADDGVEVIYFYPRSEIKKIFAEEVEEVIGFNKKDSSLYKKNPVLKYQKTNSKTLETIKIDPLASVFVNGVARISVLNDDFMMEAGNITLSDKNNDGKYDVVIIEQYEYYHVSKFDTENRIIEDIDKNKRINLEEFKDNMIAITQNGDIADESIITNNCVIELMCSFKDVEKEHIDNTKFMRINISAEIVKGRIEAIEEEFVTINGSEYRFLDELASKISSNLNVEGNFYIGYGNLIVACDDFANKQALNYAYLVKAAVEGAFDQRVSFKLYNVHGEMMYPHSAKKLRYIGMYNGKYVKGKTLKPQEFKTTVSDGQLIKYDMNEEGEITLIQTAIDHSMEENYIGYDEDAFSLDYVTQECYSGSVESGHTINTYITTCMYVSSDADNDEAFDVGPCNLYTSSIQGSTIKIYDSNKKLEGGIAIMTDIPKRGTSLGSAPFRSYQRWLITDKRMVSDGEGGYCVEIGVANGQQEWKYTATSDDLMPSNDDCFDVPTTVTKFSELRVGDYISVVTNQAGKIALYVVLNDYDETHSRVWTNAYQLQNDKEWLADYIPIVGHITQMNMGSSIRIDATGKKLIPIGRTNVIFVTLNTKTREYNGASNMESLNVGDFVYVQMDGVNTVAIIKYVKE